MKEIIITRKIQIYVIEEDKQKKNEVYKTLRSWNEMVFTTTTYLAISELL